MILQSIARLSAGIALAIVLAGCGAGGPSFQATDSPVRPSAATSS